MLIINNPQQCQQGHQTQTIPPVQQQVNQHVRPSVSQQFNPHFNQYTPPLASPLLSQPPFNPQYPAPYPGQWLQHPPSVHSNMTETSELITQVLDRQFKLYQDREDACKECERWREEREKKFREDNNNRNRINKVFEKINRFDGSNPDHCLPWMEEIFTMVHNHKTNAREELLYNSGGSIQKTLYSLSPEATEDKIHDLLLQNHSNLKTSSQCISAFQYIQQKPEELLQTYNARCQSFQKLAHEGLTIESDGSKVSCIHYANSLHGKLGDEMEERFNHRLPKNLQEEFKRAMDFEPRIPTKQRIHTRKVNEVNHIDVSSDYQGFEVNEAQYVSNPNYKGKNYNPNYQKNKNNYNTNLNSTYNNKNSSNNGNNTTNGNFKNNNKGDYTELPSNREVTLKGPVNQDQLAKIKILKNLRIYKDKLPKNQYSASGEYDKSFNKFHPKKVEVNEATVDDVIHYGMHLKKSEPEMAEAIDIFKALSNDTYYGLEEEATNPPHEEDQ